MSGTPRFATCLRPLAAGLCFTLLVLVAGRARAEGPQHWGFGQGQLATLQEQEDGSRDLVVYAAPLRAKDGPWLARWRSPKIAGAQAAAFLAAGDFRPGPVGKAYLAVVTAAAGGLDLTVYDPPEVFSTRTWTPLPAKSRAIPAEKFKGTPMFVTAGNLMSTASDRIVVLSRTGDEGDAALWVNWITPPMGPTEAAELTGAEPLNLEVDPAKVRGFAVGDFWGTGTDAICVAVDIDGYTLLRFYRWGAEVSPKACFVKVVDDASGDIPLLAPGGLAAGDFTKDGFDALVLAFDDPALPLELRVAPLREASAKPDPGPAYDGRAPSRQPLPGFGRDCSAPAMKASPEGFQARKKGPVAMAAGPLFGYVRCELTTAVREANAVDERPDAEISFVHRALTPLLTEGAPNYGWPLKGEPVTWQIVMKNNGARQIPGGATLKVWLCADRPNPDALPGAKPDAEYHVELMPPFEEMPKYVIQSVQAPWPYGLEDCPGAKWKRLDLSVTGEKWLVAVLEPEGDANERNNRIEVAWHGLPMHPSFRSLKSLTDRRPTVAGDPASKEYLARKLADAVTCLWERSGGAKNEDVLVRVFFDGYDLGWPDDAPEKDKAARWKALQERYESCRQMDLWWGENQKWERFGWKDGEGELRETARAFCPVGDRAAYAVTPVRTGVAAQGDGRPVQFATSCWGPDLFATGHAVFGAPAAEFVRRFTQGARGVKWDGWWEMAPDKVYVRVLDREGNPVPDATVSVFACGKGAPLRTGKSLPDGKFDTGHPNDSPATDLFNRKHYKAGLLAETGAVITVTIGDRHEAFLLGMDEPAAHGRYALFWHSLLDDREWVYDVRLNWKAGAPPADFTVEAAVQGSMVEMALKGPPGRTYRVYRRWEPAWIRTLAGEYPCSVDSLTIPLDLSAPDSWGKNRERALYEITAVVDGLESQAKSVSVFAVRNALGLSQHSPGRLLLANNNGKADPYGEILDGLTPERELLTSGKPGHTARRFARSAAKPSRLFATLKASDSDPPVFFEILDCPPGGIHATAYDLGSLTAKRASVKEFRVRDARQLGELNVGDLVTSNGKSSRVAAIRAECVTLEKPLFDLTADTVAVAFTRLVGFAGSDHGARELRDPRGVIVLKVADREFLAIADTGNGRVVIWDETTRYVTGYGGDKFRPCGLGIDPRDPRVFFVVDRRTDRKSHVLRLTFNGRTIERDHNWNLDAGDWENDEIGIAVTPANDENDRVRVAVTDGEKGRVFTFIVTPDRLVHDPEITEVLGTHAGPQALAAPLDCAFVTANGGVRLFAVDARDRVVELPKRWGK
ncbi:MAG: hypothetical protein HYY18_19470 [Planctomycetes bacterium]|nr:hypothetical protein [Planctomycetota bacterium]